MPKITRSNLVTAKAWVAGISAAVATFLTALATAVPEGGSLTWQALAVALGGSLGVAGVTFKVPNAPSVDDGMVAAEDEEVDVDSPIDENEEL